MRGYDRRSAPSGSPRRVTAPRGGFVRLGLHQRFVPLLIVLTLASSLGMAGLAFFGARANAISTAQSRTAQDVRVLRQLLADQGADISVSNGQLVVGQGSAQLVLNGDTTVVDRARATSGAYAAIYQLQGLKLTGISSNLPSADAHDNPLPGTRLLGDTIGGPAYDALLSHCGTTDTQSCHQTYGGIVTIHGVAYVAAYAPLDDTSGAFVGAIAAAIPLDSVLAPVTQQAVLLVLVGLLLALVALVAGYWVFESSVRRYFAALDAIGTQAAHLSALARLQAARAAQHERIAWQAGEQSRALDTLARAMEQGYTGLRDSAGELWAEMSQPGAMPDPARASAQARQAAVVAARVGTAAAQARDLCRHITLLMRQVIAQSRGTTDSGRELDLRATELRDAAERAGATPAEQLAQSREQSTTGAARPATGQHPAMRSGTPLTGTHRTFTSRPGQTGAVPRVRPSDGQERGTTGQHPIFRAGVSRATGAFPAVPPASQSPQTPGQVPPLPMRSTHAPAPGRSPDPSGGGSGERDDTHGRLFEARRTGEWPAQHPSSAPHSQDTNTQEPPPHAGGQLNHLGLPDLSAGNEILNWREDDTE